MHALERMEEGMLWVLASQLVKTCSWGDTFSSNMNVFDCNTASGKRREGSRRLGLPTARGKVKEGSLIQAAPQVRNRLQGDFEGGQDLWFSFSYDCLFRKYSDRS